MHPIGTSQYSSTTLYQVSSIIVLSDSSFFSKVTIVYNPGLGGGEAREHNFHVLLPSPGVFHSRTHTKQTRRRDNGCTALSWLARLHLRQAGAQAAQAVAAAAVAGLGGLREQRAALSLSRAPHISRSHAECSLSGPGEDGRRGIGVDVKVILTPTCVFCTANH